MLLGDMCSANLTQQTQFDIVNKMHVVRLENKALHGALQTIAQLGLPA